MQYCSSLKYFSEDIVQVLIFQNLLVTKLFPLGKKEVVCYIKER